jgi:succinoglycan biosynthesis transport protein ExoP
MAQPAGTIDLRKYLFVLRRRWALCLAVFLLVLAVGIAYCLFWPRVYEATALVVVQPQKVPGSIVKPTVTSKMEERLQIITQQVLSRTRLMEIIDRFDLYPKSRHKAVPDDLAERMRKDIAIKITRKHYFTVSFIYREPKAAASVANALAAFYVDSNLRLREEDAVGTARFLAREMERMRGQLKEWENTLTDFKKAHLHELPGSQDRLIAIAARQSNAIAKIDYHVEVERTRQNGLEFEIADLTFTIENMALKKAQMVKRGEAVGGGEDLSSDDPEPIRKELESLRVRYTDDHPDVIRLKKKLAIAEARHEAKMAKLRAEGKIKEGEGQTSGMELQLGSLKESRAKYAKLVVESKERVKNLLAERKEVEKALAQTRRYIENMPAVAERLQELSRGYDTLNQAYEKLHAKWLEANIAANLERTQRGEQFDVVDPAEVPTSPYRPDINKALPMSIAVALGLAVGLAFGLSYIDTSFTSVEQAERMSELPVLVVMPPLSTQKERTQKRRKLLLMALLYSGFGFVLLIMMGILLTGRAESFKRLVTALIS